MTIITPVMFSSTPSSMFPSLAAPIQQQQQPYPRDAAFESLPVEIRNALESLEKTVMTHTNSARRVAGYVAVDAGTGIAEMTSLEKHKETIAKHLELIQTITVKQEMMRTFLQAQRRQLGQYWRYGEAVCTSTGMLTNTAATGAIQPQQSELNQKKYANLTGLPPYELRLFEQMVDNLDQMVQEAQSVGKSLQEQLGGDAGASDDLDALKAIENNQVIIRQLFCNLPPHQSQLEEDRRAFRQFITKYKRYRGPDPFQ